MLNAFEVVVFFVGAFFFPKYYLSGIIGVYFIIE